jgi:Phage gp6-like head-tail connector protein
MADLITSTEAKTFLQIEHSDDDALIAALITGCSEALQDLIGRTFAEGTLTEYLDGGGDALILSRPPVSHIIEIHDVFGIEEVINGDFDGDADDWSLGTGWQYSGGIAFHIGASGELTQAVAATEMIGKTFLLRYSVTLTSGTLTPDLSGASGAAVTTSGEYEDKLETLGTGDGLLTFTTAGTLSINWVSLTDLTNGLIKAKDCELDPTTGLLRRIRGSRMWPEGARRYRVKCIGGQSAPERVKLAVKQWVAFLYENRTPGLAEESEGDRGVKFALSKGIPDAVMRLVGIEREVGF